MAICKMCHKSIPDGMDFCEECENKRTNQADESYLDSLLSSVTEDHSKTAADFFSRRNYSHTIEESVKPESVSDKGSEIPDTVQVDLNTEIPASDGALNLSGDIIPNAEEAAEANTFDISDEIPSDTSEDIIEESEEPGEEITEENIGDSGSPADLSNEISAAVEEENVTDTEEAITDDDIPAGLNDVSADTDNIPEPEDVISDEDISFDEADTGDEIIPADNDDISVAEDVDNEDITDETDDASEENNSDEADDAVVEDIADVAEDVAEEDISNEADDVATEDIEKDISDEAGDNTGENAEVTSDEDVDELLDSLLADMDAAGGLETEEAADPIGEDDLSEIFAAAEQDHTDAQESTTAEDDLFNISEEITAPDDITPDGDATDEGAEAPAGDLPVEDIEAPIEDLLGDSIDAPVEELTGDNSDSPAEDITADNSDAPVEDILADGIDAISLDEPQAIDPDSALADVELTEPGAAASGEAAPVEDLLGGADFLSEADLENSDGIKAVPEDSTDFNLDSLLDDLDSGELDKQIRDLDADAKDNDKKEKDKKKKDKNEKSLFQRLFGNIVEELTPEQIEAEKAKAEAAEKKKQEDAEKKKQQKELSKEEKEAKKAEDKAAKEEAAKKKAEEKKRKAEEAKAKAQKKKEEKLALEALEVNEGRINRVGASILFVIFAVIAIFIILGTNIHYYNVSIKNAQTEFDRKHYNEAYYQVYGLKIKDDDIELFDKIMTVMYVQAEENAYKYYMKSNNRERALDSLLKGLHRYDKYLELATLLDIEDDLNYVKSMILEELESEFGLSESEAYDMMKYVDNIDYSSFIYSFLGDYEVDIGE